MISFLREAILAKNTIKISLQKVGADKLYEFFGAKGRSGSPTVGGWSLIPPLLGILLMNGFMKKPYGIGLPLLLTWEDKDIPEVVAQIGGPAPARSRHKLAAARCRCYVLRRLPLPAPAKYRQNHDGVANWICGGRKFTPHQGFGSFAVDHFGNLLLSG